jgi:hypothetical protein
MSEPSESDREMAHSWALRWFGDGFDAADLDSVDVNDLIKVIATARAEGRREAIEELQAYRDAAQYDTQMSGPIFKSWNRSQLERARKLTERALAEPASDVDRIERDGILFREGEAKGRCEAIEECAKIVAEHPSKYHPVFDTELMAGCCEMMEQQIRALAEPAAGGEK